MKLEGWLGCFSKQLHESDSFKSPARRLSSCSRTTPSKNPTAPSLPPFFLPTSEGFPSSGDLPRTLHLAVAKPPPLAVFFLASAAHRRTSRADAASPPPPPSCSVHRSGQQQSPGLSLVPSCCRKEAVPAASLSVVLLCTGGHQRTIAGVPVLLHSGKFSIPVLIQLHRTARTVVIAVFPFSRGC